MSIDVRLERTDTDATALEAIDRACFSRPSLDVAAELARPFALLFAARDEAIVVGYLLAWHVADELEIHDVATAPEARRRGVGRALVDAACREAKGRGAVRAHLEVRRDNVAARGLYGALGFVEGDLRRRYYDDGEDAVLMHRELSP